MKEVNRMAKTQELLYAVVGAGDFAIDKARTLRKIDTKSAGTVYSDFVTRGRSLSKKIRTSAPSKQAVAQTKTARTQVKAAATSVSKAIRANASGSTKKAADQTKVARTQVKAATTSVTKAVKANTKAVRSAAEKVVKAS
jgi:hypothetical protein